MALFQFELLLPDGRRTSETVIAEGWRWWQAFDAACRSAEGRMGLTPFSGIRCLSYHHRPDTVDHPEPPVPVAA